MKLNTALLIGFLSFLTSLGVLFFFVESSHTHLVGGTRVPYAREINFFIKAPGGATADHFTFTTEMAQEVQDKLEFRADPGASFVGASVEAKPQKVSWTSSKIRYTVNGGLLRIAGTLVVPAGPVASEQPLRMILPPFEPGAWEFPNESLHGPGLERTLKVFFVHPTAMAAWIANFQTTAELAIAPALFLWGVALVIGAWRLKKQAERAMESLAQAQLPRTFRPNVPHIARVFGWTAMIGGGVATMFMIIAWNDLGTTMSELFTMVPATLAIILGIIFAAVVSRRLVLAELSPDALILASGNDRNRREISWGAIDAAKPMEVRSRTGQLQKEYIEIFVRGARKGQKIHAVHIAEYRLFRDLTCALWHHAHPAPAARAQG